MAAKEEAIRIEVTPTDQHRRSWVWVVWDGEEAVERGVAPSQQAAHQLAHHASLKHRADLPHNHPGHKRHKKED